MNLARITLLIACLLVGCSSAPKQADKPTPSARASTNDAQTVEAERQHERQIPCSAEWLKTATDAQRKACLNQNSINQAMNALSTRPSSTAKNAPSTSTTKQ